VLPPLHWRTRVALEDVEIAGVTIKAGDVVVPLLAAANHDAGHYACPHAVDLEQKNPRDHMTFFAGPTACPGQGLARTEMFVTLRKVLATYPTLRLDPEADPPAFAGLALRGFLPLNVLTS
jgi:cytochrome P450 monooxygenase